MLGYGEIGQAVHEVFREAHDITLWDKKFETPRPTGPFDVMLVCIPYSKNFVDIVQYEQTRYTPKAVIIFSTVAIGTTRQIAGAVHSPVEGKHPHLAESMQQMRRWVGGRNPVADRFFEQANVQPFYVDKPETTEALKLLSTSLYGVNIEFYRYAERVLGEDIDKFRLFNWDYNILYKRLGLTHFQRYLLDAPKGLLGGHCIRPNAEILDEQFPSFFLKAIIEGKGDADCLS